MRLMGHTYLLSSYKKKRGRRKEREEREKREEKERERREKVKNHSRTLKGLHFHRHKGLLFYTKKTISSTLPIAYCPEKNNVETFCQTTEKMDANKNYK